MYDLKDLLQRSIEENASDVHFTVGKPPCYRIDGVLSAIEGERLMPDTLKELLLPIMEERHREELKRDGQTDFAYAIAGVGRFRVNVFRQRGTLASVMRCLPFEIPEPENLGIPKEVVDVTNRKRGLVLVTGPTGSGKSTVAKLLMRFHDVTSGEILLNGTDIRTISQQKLREHISYVPQRAWLFSGTVADNLRFGNREATEEEMYHALEVAQAEFVRTLPQGLDERVAQGGTNFSGGQKQRLSIARALMKKADLYIFDDSFSALDVKTDSQLRKALAQEMKDRAVLIIAQRINTILHADQILVLHDGRIVGIGRHEELMRSCQVYQEIARSQMKGGEADA